MPLFEYAPAPESRSVVEIRSSYGLFIDGEFVDSSGDATGQMVGVKPAGGIRTAKDAIKYLVMVNEVAGTDWLDPDWFRFGASTLLNDLLMQRTKMRTGRYSGPDYFTLD